MKYNEEELAQAGYDCTDPDNCQYCLQLSETKFHFVQKGNLTGWGEATIDLNNYTAEEIDEYLSSFYQADELHDNQTIAECIFELTDGALIY